ncbi:MAG: acylphosphatase, partial [Acidobacteriaceae bacterium]
MATTPYPPTVRRKISIRGVVQGVGFRPFVYNLARSLDLSGYVLNSSSGVTIEVEGAEPEIERFVEEVQKHPPPLARITDFDL